MEEIKIIWEYIVKDEYLEQFIQLYSSTGKWSDFFLKHPGYLGTELVRDSSVKNRFITIDHWSSLSTYSDMKNRSRKEYKSLDEQYEKYTTDENYLGIFTVL